MHISCFVVMLVIIDKDDKKSQTQCFPYFKSLNYKSLVEFKVKKKGWVEFTLFINIDALQMTYSLRIVI